MQVADLTGYKRRNPDVKHASVEAVLAEAKAQLRGALAWQPDMVGFYSIAPVHPMVLEFLALVRQERPGTPTVVGGPHANTDPDGCLRDGFDAVVVADQGGGGGEQGALAAFAGARGIIREKSRTGATWEGDLWPLPARDLIDLDSYEYRIKGERATSLISTFGCPYACTYCSHWGGYRKLEGKSSARVYEELVSIESRYGIRAIMDYSDEINLRPDFEDEFLPMMRRWGGIWRAFFKNGRNLTRPEVFEKMAAAGCVQLCTGAESANDDILRDIRKGATRQHNTDFVRYCVKYGIEPKVFTQVGLPGETPDTVKELRDWIVGELAPLGLRDFDVTITTPMAGTPIYETPEKFPGIHFDKDRVRLGLYKTVPGEYHAGVHHDTISAAELVAARQWVEDEGRKACGLQPLVAKDDG